MSTVVEPSDVVSSVASPAADSDKAKGSNFAEGGAVEHVKQYHLRTKHRFSGYAKGPETLDWDDQPNPFRYFKNAQSVELPFVEWSQEPAFSQLDSTGADDAAPQPLTLETISWFLSHSLGLTGWKQFGPDKWSLRINPSSGNLHPTDAYLLLGNASQDLSDGLPNGLYSFNVEQFNLEKRASSSFDVKSGFLLGLTSVTWREAWKYGERSFRYCQLDMGHALSSLSFAAQALGWQVIWLKDLPFEIISNLLGLTRPEFKGVESEEPEALLYVGEPLDQQQLDTLQHLPESSDWQGQPNALGGHSFYKWPIIDSVADASRDCLQSPDAQTKRTDQSVRFQPVTLNPVTHNPVVAGSANGAIAESQSSSQRLFSDVVTSRRSAQQFNRDSISLEQFKNIVSSQVTKPQAVLSAIGSDKIFTVLLVHRVNDLAPGVYLITDKDFVVENLKDTFSKWDEVVEITDSFCLPGDNRVYCLKEANVQRAAATLCCHQPIASDCAFTVSYVAPFSATLSAAGAIGYRYMHWQAGMLAHQVYLSATKNNLTATGIGCFFDDPWHELLGFHNNDNYQFVYHIAVGHAFSDNRITSLSGYYHLLERVRNKTVI